MSIGRPFNKRRPTPRFGQHALLISFAWRVAAAHRWAAWQDKEKKVDVDHPYDDGCAVFERMWRGNPDPRSFIRFFQSLKVAAWHGLNGDGRWNMSEPPLEGVRFDLQSLFAQKWGPDPDLGKGEG